MSFDFQAMRMEENSQKLKMTILYRSGGKWHIEEVRRLVLGLTTEASQLPIFPEYVVLFGHFTKEQTLEALLGGVAYTATQVTGVDSKELPFNPGFI
jgi:hypothetical protein